MLVKVPEVAAAAYRSFGDRGGFIGRILLRIDQIAHERIDFRRLETGEVDAEVAFGKQGGELAEFDR
jgi:hypothetical protein